jgi:hypothetical protein
VPNGCLDATTDSDKIQTWWEMYPDANIGIATGQESGLLVLDADSEEGRAALAKLGLPETPVVETGREDGGEQHYLEYPAGSGLTIGQGNQIGMPGLDYRGQGGYVIAPPSMHRSGKRYQWKKPLSDAVPLGKVSAEVIATLKQKKTTAVAEAKQAHNPWIVRADSDDLLTHPGASFPQRRVTYLRLAGSHFAMGDSEVTIARLSAPWAAKCKPPFDEWRKHFGSLAKKERANREAARPAAGREGTNSRAENTEILPSFPPSANSEKELEKGLSSSWPTLSPAAYHGLFGEMLKAIEPETEAEPTESCLDNAITTRPGEARHPGGNH